MKNQLTIVTYGGGDVLEKIFNGIAMLSQKGEIFYQLCMVMILLTSIYIAIRAYFGLQAPIKGYFVFVAFVFIFCISSKATVHIEDVFRNRAYTVSNVPLALAKASELFSTIGFKVTKSVERVMHTANSSYTKLSDSGNDLYGSTGMIFGAESIMDLGRYRVNNGDLKQNLQKFAKQCITFDLAHRRYAFEDLRNSEDLWNFLKTNTSKLRMVDYKDPKEKNVEYLTCQQALAKMESDIGKEKDRIQNEELLKHLPFAYKVLTGVSKDASNLFSQQLMVSYLADNFSSEEYAKTRAKSQQTSTYRVMGALASSSLLAIRAVLEPLIYFAFIFVLPLSLVPSGAAILKSWVEMVIWIQLWPPFYAVLNYIQQIASHTYAATVFPNLTKQSITVANSIALENLNADISALAGYIAVSIPFISYAVAKGGVGSLMHMAGSLMTPAHSAASAAAGELTTGNYSYGNLSLENSSYANSSQMQNQLAPSISQGFTNINRGDYSLMESGSRLAVNEKLSTTHIGTNAQESLSNIASDQLQVAQTEAQVSAEQLLSSRSHHAKNTLDLASHIGNSTSLNSSLNERESSSYQEASHKLSNIASNFAKNHSMTEQEARGFLADVHAGVGLEIFGTGGSIKGGLSFSGSFSDSEMFQEAKNITESKDFQESFQKVQDYSSSLSFNQGDDIGRRLSESFSQSSDQMTSSQESYNQSLSQLETASKANSYIQTNSASITKNCDQSIFEFACSQYGEAAALEMIQNQSPEYQKIANEWIAYEYENIRSIDSPKFEEINVNYIERPSYEVPEYISKDQLMEDNDFISENSLYSQKDNFGNLKSNVNQSADAIKNEVISGHNNLKSEYDDNAQMSGLERGYNGFCGKMETAFDNAKRGKNTLTKYFGGGE